MDNRTRSLKWRQLVGLWLGAEYGIKLKPRPYIVKLTEQMDEGFEQGHLLGLPNVLLNVSAEREYLPGQRLDNAKADAALGSKGLFFSIQRRQDRTDLGDSIVVTSLDCLGIILQRLSRLEEIEAAS